MDTDAQSTSQQVCSGTTGAGGCSHRKGLSSLALGAKLEGDLITGDYFIKETSDAFKQQMRCY